MAKVKQRFNRAAAARVLDELRAVAFRAGIAAVADRLALDPSEDEIDDNEGLAEIGDNLMWLPRCIVYSEMCEAFRRGRIAKLHADPSTLP